MEHSLSVLARERFSLDYLFPYQRLVITNILTAAGASARDGAEEDVSGYGRQIVILPTGAGKSLCFQLPAAVLPGTTLVVYPLLSLMNDQARRMSEGGFSVVQLKGGQVASERRSMLKKVRTGDLDFVITNPETLQNRTIRETLKAANLVHAVIDEAHCISEWGDSFRPLYLTLGEALRDLSIPIVTAFTATAGDHVLNRIREVLFPDSGARVIRGNPDRENISYSVIPCVSRLHAIRTIFRNNGSCTGTTGQVESAIPQDTLPVWHPGDPIPLPAIVFCATRAETRRYAAHLENVLGEGRAFYYHAGLEREQKKTVEDRFFRARDAVLCATCAYGMGVDKPDIRAVVHIYLPGSVEAFLQESGRGGRDRQPARSIVLVDPKEDARFRGASLSGDASVVQRMAFGKGCRREPLLLAMGTTPDACSGCDQCENYDGSATHRGDTQPGGTPAATFIRDLVRESPIRLTATEWIRVLRGLASWQDRCRGFSRRREFGVLRHWKEEELREAFDQLLGAGFLAERRDRLLAAAGHAAEPAGGYVSDGLLRRASQRDRPRPSLLRNRETR